MEENGRGRVLILAGAPEVACGRYPAKRVVGEPIVASCDLVSDGHDAVAGYLLVKRPGEAAPKRIPLVPKGNDRFEASFVPDVLGRWEIGFTGWIDAFATWSHDTARKAAAGQDVAVELLGGSKLLAAASARARAAGDEGAAAVLAKVSSTVGDARLAQAERLGAARGVAVSEIVARHPDLENASRYDKPLAVVVDRELARCGAWYEFFPRSCGTLKDARARLEYAAQMGFDVVYLPPIHPIGRAFRKGKNNALDAKPDDVGSPWAIGASEGGHKAVHPDLGTLEDVRAFVKRARELGVEVAIDVAFQVSPDHPYVKQHPEWFKKRADGTIQYAENPPKKYQDVYPFDFETTAWRALWDELASVFFFWAEQGVTVFRVDNPHTKALRFWEWCIARVKEEHPEAIFLAEAFTRPKLMYALAMGGFTQSYTYFTWRTTKPEIEAWMRELTSLPVSDFYRPNLWPNTPDILPEHLMHARRPAFVQRLVLAATLSSSYGVYGPAFELMENEPRPGTEEYVDNEKYELRKWDVGREDSLRDVITRINRVRHENRALQDNARLVFHRTDNEHLLAYSKSDGGESTVLVVVNLDVHHRHSGWIELDHAALGVGRDERFQVHDALSDARFHWHGARAYVELDPRVMPAHVFRVRRKIRSEHDFEYFL
jgi:starch synthase (maltosyl-transferring)